MYTKLFQSLNMFIAVTVFNYSPAVWFVMLTSMLVFAVRYCYFEMHMFTLGACILNMLSNLMILILSDKSHLMTSY